jgi:hypothetical protein
MAIRLDSKAIDAQGLPVVSWEEDRNLFAPGGATRARVACFIRPDADGVLQFVSVGAVRHGAFEEARPWAQLVSFAIERADHLYYPASERAVLDVLAGSSKTGASRLLTTDGALVIVANFADEKRSVPMHLNCADCAPVEAAMLHDRLRLEFLDRQKDLIDEQCDSKFVWPKDKPFEAYSPVSVTECLPRGLKWLADIVILGAIGLIVWVTYWLYARL